MTKRFLPMCLIWGLAACGSSSNTTATSATTTDDSAANPSSPMYSSASASSVGVQMTDAPASLSLLASVNVTLDKVEVHVVPKDSQGGAFDPNLPANGNSTSAVPTEAQDDNSAYVTNPNDASIDDDAYWQSITLAATSFNLLALQGNVTAVVGGLDLPTGVLTQIRLFIDPNATHDVVLKDNSVCTLDVSSVVGKGFKIDDDFPHVPLHDGNTTNFIVDFDLQNSLSQDGNCAFSLHPVFHLRDHDVAHRPDGGWAGQHGQNGNVTATASGSASVSSQNGNVTVGASASESGESQSGHSVVYRPRG